MSGGHFDYVQYHIEEIYSDIEEYLCGHDLDECDVEKYIKDHFIDEDEATAYIRKHKHTVPNPYGYSKETIREFRKAVRILKQAHVYAQRIDWLLSGDDGEDNFHERLKEDLDKLKIKKKE